MPRGDIVVVDLPATSGGHEQEGLRPALVVHDDDAISVSIIVIIPCTSRLAALRFPHTVRLPPSAQNGLTQESVLLVFQLRAVDRRRVQKRIGRLDASLMHIVDAELRAMLGV